MQNEEKLPNQVAAKCEGCGRELNAGEHLYHSKVVRPGYVCVRCSVAEMEDRPSVLR